jgi:hypothetical protein
MSLLHVLPFISTLVTLAFAVAVFMRYARKGGIHLLMWGIGLTMYGLGTLAEAWLFFQYDPFWLKLWYLMGAILTSAWLGQGTLFLLVRRPGVAPALTVVLGLATLVAAVWVFTLPLAAQAYNLSLPVSAQYTKIMTVRPVALLIAFTTYGTVLLVGGAIYSAYLFWRKRVLPQRVIGNVLIAAGALSPALGGVVVARGLGDYLFVSELLGAILMFIGFLFATGALASEPAEQPASQAAH